ncbi:arginine permease [Sodiomyces alkalinus F11]|uniref:Arginine permease n=1 Tax=Sodiomyces alkalinus (strain CBS 110278 / VKM F-3762 / F11) TaxID=1314773 RepID=A0A3N2PTV1_SODAK|nr:arginine permease [Sodiomyces alkalinus F11]ROT37756.1 arginine permease [Sodiomyces alkalinus F11]
MFSEKTPRASSVERSGPPSLGEPNLKADLEVADDAGLQRHLRARHLQFIAIGGTVGTGLFLGTSSALSEAGPVGALIAFIFIGTVVYSVMTSLGEMATYIPVAGSFTAYATRFAHPSFGFAMGWTYWFSWSVTYALELVAAGLIIQYWDSGLNVGIFIAVFWVVFTALNFLPVRWFGEIEMWFSMIKVVTIVGWLIFAVCINAGVGDEGYLGFKYWESPGPFVEHIVPGSVGKFVGFWATLVIAGFSFQGAELVGIGAGEAHDPRRSVPRAIRNTFWGIFVLFVATVFFIGTLVPSNDPALLNESKNANASPLVIAAKRAGVDILPDIINAVLLTAVLSAANSNVYSGSRVLIALAEGGVAPKFLTKTNSHGTPYYAVGITASIGLLAFLNLSADGGKVFDWLLNIIAVAGFVTWSGICVCHLRFMAALRAQGIDRSTLPYTAPLQPYLAWYGLFFTFLILLTNGFTVFIDWDTSSFFASYVSLVLFVVLFVGHKLITKSHHVRLVDVDLVKGRIEL